MSLPHRNFFGSSLGTLRPTHLPPIGGVFSGKNIFHSSKALLCGLSCCSKIKFFDIKFLYKYYTKNFL